MASQSQLRQEEVEEREVDELFTLSYLEDLKKELEKFKRYGGFTISTAYTGERITPRMIERVDGALIYEALGVQSVGPRGRRVTDPFRIEVASPEKCADELKKMLDGFIRSYHQSLDPLARKQFTVDVVPGKLVPSPIATCRYDLE